MDILAIVKVILILALLGFLIYLIVTYIPMPEIFKQVIMVFVAVLVILWLIAMIAGAAPLGVGAWPRLR